MVGPNLADSGVGRILSQFCQSSLGILKGEVSLYS
jgi:hypothetical protein